MQAQTITTIAGPGIVPGAYSGDGGAATAAGIGPVGISVDGAGNIFFTETGHRIRKVDGSGTISTIAGTGISGFSGDGGPATVAKVCRPGGIAIDASGNIYFCDSMRVRKIDVTGIVTTVAGTGVMGYTGDAGAATLANIYASYGICLDGVGNLYISDDHVCHCVRKIDPGGIISTVAGNGVAGYSGDGSAATAAQLYGPKGLATDNYGHLYIADGGTNRIRKVDVTGTISTVAGNGVYSYAGDGGAATAASVAAPYGIAIDENNNLYIGNYISHVVRVVNSAGIISTFAGIGIAGYTGDGGQARNARCMGPRILSLDGAGELYIGEIGNHVIRKIQDDAPSFAAGIMPLTVCGPTPVNTVLAVADADTGQELSWQLVAAPVHGSVSIGFTTVATGATVTPTGLTYYPIAGYDGADTFKVRVYDGMLADTVVVALAVHATTPGTVSGPDTVCVGGTITLASTSGGGAWSITGGTAAISAGGVVTGITAGTATASYTVSNVCTMATAWFPLVVADCTAAVVAAAGLPGNVRLFPNPSNGRFTLLSALSGTAIVTDVTGRVVGSAEVIAGTPAELYCSMPGLYFVLLSTPAGPWAGKMVVE